MKKKQCDNVHEDIHCSFVTSLVRKPQKGRLENVPVFIPPIMPVPSIGSLYSGHCLQTVFGGLSKEN